MHSGFSFFTQIIFFSYCIWKSKLLFDKVERQVQATFRAAAFEKYLVKCLVQKKDNSVSGDFISFSKENSIFFFEVSFQRVLIQTIPYYMLHYLVAFRPADSAYEHPTKFLHIRETACDSARKCMMIPLLFDTNEMLFIFGINLHSMGVLLIIQTASHCC